MSEINFGTLKVCPACKNDNLIDLTLECHESWKYCNWCRRCWTEPMEVPKEQVAEWFTEMGFPKDAQRVKDGKPISEDGE